MKKELRVGTKDLRFLEDIKNAAQRLTEYKGKYICDGVQEVCNAVSVAITVDMDLAVAMEGYIAEALGEGMVTMENFSIDRMVKEGYYLMLETYLSDNLSEIAYNMLVDYTQAEELELDEDAAEQATNETNDLFNGSWNDVIMKYHEIIHNAE